MDQSSKYILWFSEIRKEDIPQVGGKGANLGELTSFNIPVPPGFVVNSQAYFDFLAYGSLVAKIKHELKGLTVKDSQGLLTASKNIETSILNSKIPQEIEKEIIEAYHRLSGTHDLRVAVRSSATAEDLPEASFAGQQESYLNVTSGKNVVESVRKCWASLFEPRAIFYRQDMGYDHFKVGLAAVVQKMVASEVSGIMFTIDPLTNDASKISIEGAFGLGQPIVSGEITPDQYLVNKSNYKVVKKIVIRQLWQLVLAGKVKISKDYQNLQKLKDPLIKELAKIGRTIEEHYGQPQDIEWALSNHHLYIVQARPVTTAKIQNSESTNTSAVFHINSDGLDEKLLLTGIPASRGIASGPVIKVASPKDITKVKEGDILVAHMTSPDYVPAMKKAKAIVTDEGGRTSHAAIVSRELRIPCVVGTIQATSMLKEGEIITVDGEAGKIYEGNLIENFSRKKNLPSQEKSENSRNEDPQIEAVKTATKVYVNLADPDEAYKLSQKEVDGVGLMRAEFIMAGIGEHPQAVIKAHRQENYIRELAESIGKVAKAFNPRPVVYRTSDFRTNEYRHLKGGEKFEPDEENPMIGFRGALRYITDPEVFKMEIKAVLNVRHKMNLRNLWLMIPFCRTVSELREVKKIMAATGLKRGGSFKLWLMVEIPSNVILLEEFINEGIDGISIGTNDLTMLTLGVDRDNSRLASLYSEEDEAVRELITQTIKTCKRLGVTASVCGEAPSTYPNFLKMLVRLGTTSVSVDPDVIESVRENISQEERLLIYNL